MKYEKGDRFPQIVVLGILFFASLSTAATPIAHTVTTMALSLYENDAGVPVNFVSYTIFGVAACLVTFAASHGADQIRLSSRDGAPEQSGQLCAEV